MVARDTDGEAEDCGRRKFAELGITEGPAGII